jgi:hypothetical protein
MNSSGAYSHMSIILPQLLNIYHSSTNCLVKPVYICFASSMVKQNKVASLHAMKVYGGREIQLHLFFPLALDGGVSSALCYGCITAGKEPLLPIEWEADWAPALFWTLWSRKMSVALLGIKL